MTRYQSILETVGNTPSVKIARLAPSHVDLYVKIEAFNPMGSVKDRLALGVIEDAERRGLLKPGQTVVEATSGNTGIGLAMVCAAKGYPLVVTMAESFSVERRRLMRFLGAKVVLTPAAEKGTGMLAKAVELAKAHGWFLCRQFENEANAEMHSRTTAQEILRDFAGGRLDAWVTGTGTGGTLKGVARVLREARPKTRIVVCEPDNAPMLASGTAQPPDDAEGMTASHPMFRPHLMQGWSPDFIPKLTADALAAGHVDEILPIAGDDALRLARELARREGIFTGITGGATFAGALAVAEKAEAGATILCMLPDTGERYLSTPLFEGFAAEMDDEEIAISRSTPRYRFDRSAPAPATGKAAPAPAATPAAREFVDRTVADQDRPVVMFALEWCEFCWSVRKMFKAAGIAYRSVDLDSVEYQKENWGGQVRAALLERLGIPTIPQIFVGGVHVGGCTETLDAYNDGRLAAMLQASNVSIGQSDLDAYGFLPAWLHPR